MGKNGLSAEDHLRWNCGHCDGCGPYNDYNDCIAVVAWPDKSIPQNCVPTKYKPDLSLMKVKNVVSADKTASANLVGYLELVKDGTHLAFEVSGVSVGRVHSNEKLVTLSTNCIEFDVVHTDSVSYSNLNVHAHGYLSMAVKNEAEGDKNLRQI